MERIPAERLRWLIAAGHHMRSSNGDNLPSGALCELGGELAAMGRDEGQLQHCVRAARWCTVRWRRNLGIAGAGRDMPMPTCPSGASLVLAVKGGEQRCASMADLLESDGTRLRRRPYAGGAGRDGQVAARAQACC